MKQLLLYLPVIHAGYEKLLAQFSASGQVLILGESFGTRYRVIAKEIRALSPRRAAQYLSCVESGLDVRVVEEFELREAISAELLVVPDEDLMRSIVADYRLDEVASISYERTFLRWDRGWSRTGRPAHFDGKVSLDDFAAGFGQLALDVAGRSSDWWRQVGAVAVRDGRTIYTAHNTHWPSEYSPYIDGDPRNNFSRGIEPELTTAMHAEAALVAKAARSGARLEGADLYVSTFPCPTCARLIAQVGFARCYFAGPYSLLEGEEILRRAGVQVYFVELPKD